MEHSSLCYWENLFFLNTNSEKNIDYVASKLMKYYYIIINILSYLFEKNAQDLVALVKSGKRNWVTKLISFLYFWTLK